MQPNNRFIYLCVTISSSKTNMLTDHSSRFHMENSKEKSHMGAPETQQRTSTTIASNLPIDRIHGNGSDNRRDFDASLQMHSHPFSQESVHQSLSMAQTGYAQNSFTQAKGSDGRGDASNVVIIIDFHIGDDNFNAFCDFFSDVTYTKCCDPASSKAATTGNPTS